MTRRLTVTKSSLTGKKLRDLHFREAYEVSVTRVIRSGVELVARPDLYLQMGDGLICIGAEQNIKRVAEQVGNSSGALDKPNLVPIFLGIVVGIIFGSLPIRFPGIEPVSGPYYRWDELKAHFLDLCKQASAPWDNWNRTHGHHN